MSYPLGRNGTNLLLLKPGSEVWFTDGSGQNSRFGAGIYGPEREHRESISLGKLSTVFQVEVMTILMCAEILTTVRESKKNIIICSDSRAAIEALIKPYTESTLVWEGMQALTRLGRNKNIILSWIPGHQGIHGNEVADVLARKGAAMAPLGQVVGVPFAVGKRFLKEALERDHLNRWRAINICRQAKLLMGQSEVKRTNELLSMSRQRLRVGISLQHHSESPPIQPETG